MIGTLLRYPYKVRSRRPEVRRFGPEKFEDDCEKPRWSISATASEAASQEQWYRAVFDLQRQAVASQPV